MSIYAITAEDTLTLYNRVFNDFADGDTTTIAFTNDLFTSKTGKNKNTIYAINQQGNNATLTLRLVRGSSDDQFLRNLLTAAKKDAPSAVLANGQFVKRLGDGQGNVIRDVYTLLGGIFMRNVDGKENQEGDTEQAVSVYTFTFADVQWSVE